MDWNLALEVIGVVGAIEVLIAYGLNMYKRLASDALAFYLLNLSGGLLLAFYTFEKEAWSSMAINVVWVVIPMIHLVRHFQKRRTG